MKLTAPVATPFMAALVRAPAPRLLASRLDFTPLARFWRSEEEMDRFLVLISNMSRFLLVMPESMVMRIQTKLAIVRPYGTATQTNLPAPILVAVYILRGKFLRGCGCGCSCSLSG